MKKIVLLLFLLLILLPVIIWGQTTVFVDDFNRVDYTSGGTPAMSYTLTASQNVGTASSSSNYLNLAGSSTTGGGVEWVSGSTSTFSSLYNTTLSSNCGVIEWTFNMRWNRASSNNPAQLSNNQYSTAVILAGTAGSTLTSGTGYMVEYGNSSTPDPIRLVKYTAGFGTITSIISSGVSDIANTNNYASIRVTYDPSTNSWSLYVRDDGSSAWSDPSSGVTSQEGTTTVDNTYTGTALTFFGFAWSYNITTTNTGQFDNFKVAITISPASSVDVVGTGSGTGTISWTAPPVYNNSYNETIVFLKDGSAITEGTPTNDIAGYTASTAFGSGTAYQNDVNAFCIYKGDGISVDITNITNGHTYYALVYNTNGSTSYSSSATNSAALPVELTSFKSIVKGNKIELDWSTATEVNNYGFEVQRASTKLGTSWEKIGFVQGHGNSNAPKNYTFTDEPTGGREFQYRLKQIDFNGTFEYSEIVTAVLENVSEFKLDQNYPNPFNPTTRISYTLPVRASIKLRVYDILAQVIADLVNGIQEAGRYEVTFDGSNFPSGAYFYKLEAGNYVEVKKFLLVK